ncbi:MAG TPA: hypothetical protein VD999_05780 [Vitreimonas sp.]|nr:hypothetical protein [Vitreimonas sp.]
MANVNLDISDFLKKSGDLLNKVIKSSPEALEVVADEILRLSQREVPHDEGGLQNSGHVEPRSEEVLVGYNKPYAARLHEHPEYNFQKGRKGKYLEDPIKNNLNIFRMMFSQDLSGAFK